MPDRGLGGRTEAPAAKTHGMRVSDMRRGARSRISPGLLFIAPATLMVLVFSIYPIFGTAQLSLTSWDGFSPVREFVGAENFRRLFESDLFWSSLGRSFLWVAALFVSVALGLTMALLLWIRPRGWTVFRTVYLIPEMLGSAIVGLIWLRLWQPVTGGMVGLGEMLGIDFLTSSPLAQASQAIWVMLGIQIWISVGFFVVVSLGGLQSVDDSLLEAASLDGASRFQRIRHVVLPQMRSQVRLMSLLAAISGVKVFDLVWTMTEGGPGDGTQVLGTLAYAQAFRSGNFGYAAALSLVTAVVAVVMAILTGRGSADE